ncbi:Phospholipid N-methyltransferase [Paenibacillus sp. 1_12]|uniref:class I SAM-dependent methyltransferase n=1 Tax=Paenibacillus sp. 1_12 TaxID=1566278 RepID=UPI0008E3508F|nr:methyltransferase [Paenibacillus sp. 1_12]SFL81486.1 Phospholipid N-methyltransferase [Paenibacillus sp. 1_12]
MNANETTTLQKMLFFYKFIRTPKAIGSVTPSSRHLANKMVAAVQWNDITSVAELGAGTGVITQAIHRSLKQETKVMLFERDSHLRKQLEQQHPGFTTHSDAKSIHSVVRQQGLSHVDCIISGLPFANFPQQVRNDLMEQIVKSLKPNGLFIAFQYTLQMKKQLSQHFEIEAIQFVMLNVPPAFVYVCRKKQSSVINHP